MAERGRTCAERSGPVERGGAGDPGALRLSHNGRVPMGVAMPHIALASPNNFTLRHIGLTGWIA
jgi:hypothetical protein